MAGTVRAFEWKVCQEKPGTAVPQVACETVRQIQICAGGRHKKVSLLNKHSVAGPLTCERPQSWGFPHHLQQLRSGMR